MSASFNSLAAVPFPVFIFFNVVDNSLTADCKLEIVFFKSACFSDCVVLSKFCIMEFILLTRSTFYRTIEFGERPNYRRETISSGVDASI